MLVSCGVAERGAKGGGSGVECGVNGGMLRLVKTFRIVRVFRNFKGGVQW
jgi:hypothetical protein